jgi:hypothetical protein
MKKLALALSIGMTACSMDGAEPELVPLAEDAHFVALVAPYASPEACLASAEQPFSCQFSLSLCKSGRAGMRRGDLVSTGVYGMTGAIATATFDDGSDFALDTVALVEVDMPDAHWIVDTLGRYRTLQFDNIDCARP